MKRVVAALMIRGDSQAPGAGVRDGEVLVCQRRADQPMPLKWEFPGGKIEPGESSEMALRRELREELGVEAEIGRRTAILRHSYHSGEVELEFFVVERYAGEITNFIFQEVRWEKLTNLPRYDFLDADRLLVADLAGGKLL
jgi:8-oxo-dGTP diphosphatase